MATGTYIKVSIKSDSTVTDSAAKSLSDYDAWETISQEWATNPATGNPWTWDEIDALQIGVSLIKGLSLALCTQVYVEVDYGGGVTSTETLSPNTVVDDPSVGTGAWVNPNNAKASDDAYAEHQQDGYADSSLEAVKIVKSDGSIGTENKASEDPLTSTEKYLQFGGGADLWSETWTAEDINDADFGVVIQARDSGFSQYYYSHYLKATNFGFSIPSGATINGILAEVEAYDIDLDNHNHWTRVDHIRITVYYTILGLSIVGTLGRKIFIAVGSGAVTPVGILTAILRILQTVGQGVITPIGTLGRKIAIAVGAGTITPAGVLGRFIKITVGAGVYYSSRDSGQEDF